MQLHSISHFPQSSHCVWLYSAVYTGKIATYAVLFLFVSFLIQPVHQALANESAAESLSEEVESVVVENPGGPEVSPEQEIVLDDPDIASAVDEPILNPDSAQSEQSETVGVTTSLTPEVTDDAGQLPEQDTVASTSDTSDIPTTTDETISSSTDAVDTGGTGSTTELSQDTSTDDSILGSSSDTPTEQDDTVDSDQDDTSSETQEDVSTADGSSEGGADNSDDSVQQPEDQLITEGVNDIVNEVVTLTRQLVTEENYYQFSRKSCAPVGDGTFHCSMNTEPVIDSQAVVYAEKDVDGDMEIFMRTSKGDVEQITDNNYDDTSPDFDAKSMRIVWQQLIEGRYQVMSYDLNTKKTTQLTFARTNSMEPKVSVDGITWQMWDGEDWEIIYFDGKFADQITDNNIQDVTPVIEDGYILWSILGGESQEARVYSLETKEILTIQGHEGGAIANPRFVLVYDTKFDNGDIVTQGFDPVTGLSAPIAAKPAENPIDIPEADPIGEIRALIQNKSIGKEQKIVSDATKGTATSTDAAVVVSVASSSSNALDLSALQTEFELDIDAASTTLATEPAFELDEYDLVITDTASSTTSSRPSVYEINLAAQATEVASSTQQ